MRILIIAAMSFLAASPALAQQDFSKVEIKTTSVEDGIYMLEGWGGNIGLSVGDDGAFVIDDQFAPLNAKLMAAITAVTDKPVEFVLNTHHHGDHTGGNAALSGSGATIIAHDNVRSRLAADEKVAPDALPVITFSQTVTIRRNGHEIHIYHPENAHTDGDAVVFFRDVNVVHMGDILFSGMFPYIDIDGGGNLNGYIAALEAANHMVDGDTKIIPGHGPLSSKTDLEASIEMLKTVRARIQALIDDGLDEDEAVAANPLADFHDAWNWNFITTERMTRIAHRSLKPE